jgi:hypothetical protein
MKKPKLGTGKRFSSFVGKLERQGYGEKSAKAIAASAGRKAHGQKAMTKYSKMGKARAKKGY